MPNPWPARVAALLLAALLHSLLWWIWQNRPARQPARIAQTLMEVALMSAPVAQSQPAPPAAPPQPAASPQAKPQAAPAQKKPVPKKPSPAPKPVADTPAQPTAAPAAEAPPTPSPAPSPPAPAPFQEANYKAAYLHNPPTRYPAIARDRRWQGEVLLRVRILAEGTAGEIRLERSSGHDTLDEAAMESVQHWRFVPAKEGDKAVDSWAIIPILFKLTN